VEPDVGLVPVGVGPTQAPNRVGHGVGQAGPAVGHGLDRAQVAHHHLQQGEQVVGVPVALGVALAHAGAARQPGPVGRRPVHPDGDPGLGRVAEAALSFGVLDHHPPGVDPGEEGVGGTAGETVGDHGCLRKGTPLRHRRRA
jgi:hypothetical protein